MSLGPPRDRRLSGEKIAVGLLVQASLFVAIWVQFRVDVGTALVRVAQVDLAFLGALGIAVVVLLARHETASGLAGVRGITTMPVAALQDAIHDAHQVEPEAFRAGGESVFLGWRTARSRFTFSDWMVLEVSNREDGRAEIVVAAWHVWRSFGFFSGRRSLDRLVDALPLVDTATLRHRSAQKVVAEWIRVGALTRDGGTARPAWIRIEPRT